MNAPAYNPAAGGPAAIDAQPPSGEREALIYQLRTCYPYHDYVLKAADMLAADANIRAIGPNVTTGELFSDWYDALPYGEPSYQETFQAGFEHGAVAQQVVVPQGWANIPEHHDRFIWRGRYYCLPPPEPASAKPLTDDQIDAALASIDVEWWDVPMGATTRFARAIEAAHNIREQP